MACVMACCLDEFGAYKWTLCAKEDIVCGVVSAIASDAGPALYSKYLQNRERDICSYSTTTSCLASDMKIKYIV